MKSFLGILGASTTLLALVGWEQTRPQQGNLRVGDIAPTFKLKYLGKNEFFDLKENFGKKPTILIFGSYT
jgi:hypothetical protein